MNKENSFRSINSTEHPSRQSQQSQYKPSIKVGYKQVQIAASERRSRRKIEPAHEQKQKIDRRKMIEQVKTQISGKFFNSEYVKQSETGATVHQKKGVAECQQKYQSGQGVKQEITSQFIGKNSKRSYSTSSVASSRTQNSLPSYKDNGIKDIMQYQHALPYRQTPVTQKCTRGQALSRFVNFSQVNQFDFRKRPQFLR